MVKRTLGKLVGASRADKEIELDELLNIMNTTEETPYEDADALVLRIVFNGDEDAVKEVIDQVTKGNILVLNIKDAADRNQIRLKGAIGKVKVYIQDIDGDMVRLTQDLVLVTPSKVKIVKATK
ncbi:MAG: cell division protein SepF [Candidatus Diapherotrites archaeon]|nr:cell division protein SepF [Candidatus Diapherotrites archaeon]